MLRRRRWRPKFVAMELRPLSTIHTNEANPRFIRDEDFARLVLSLIDFPEMLRLRPSVVDEQGTVLGGNMRLRAKTHLLALADSQKVLMMADAMERRAKEQNLEQSQIDNHALLGYQVLLKELFYAEEMPVAQALGLTDTQKAEFIIKDNTGFGEWDWDELANSWGHHALDAWGMDLPSDWLNTDIIEDISLPAGEKAPFKQMSFMLTDLQAQDVDTALMLAKAEEVDNFEGTGNDNSNGNALAAVVAFYVSAKRKTEE